MTLINLDDIEPGQTIRRGVVLQCHLGLTGLATVKTGQQNRSGRVRWRPRFFDQLFQTLSAHHLRRDKRGAVVAWPRRSDGSRTVLREVS